MKKSCSNCGRKVHNRLCKDSDTHTWTEGESACSDWSPKNRNETNKGVLCQEPVGVKSENACGSAVPKSDELKEKYWKGFYDGQRNAFKHMEKIAKACRKVAVFKK